MQQLSKSRALAGKKNFRAAEPYTVHHDHGSDEPCGESCSKDHKHEDHPLNVMVGLPALGIAGPACVGCCCQVQSIPFLV